MVRSRRKAKEGEKTVYSSALNSVKSAVGDHVLSYETVVDIIVFSLIYWYILGTYDPSFMLSKTITTGGDMASHYYPAKYLQEYLLPQGRIIGWTQGWYVGMPFFQFYFPVPFVLIALLGYIIPLQISFKLVTALGVFLLPLTAYLCMRLLKLRFPMPIFAATFAIPFLFMESHSMWGGNIPSTLAGEFSYGISLSLVILFFGTLYYGLKEREYLLHNAILLAIIALTHVYTVLWAVSTSAFLLFMGDRKRLFERLFYLAKVYALSFMLAGFWVLPLLSRLGYTTSYDIPWTITENILPTLLWPFAFLSVIGLISTIINREYRISFLLFSIVVSLAFFFLAPKIGVVDIRFLPFIYLVSMFMAAYGLSETTKSLKALTIVPILVVFLTMFWTNEYNAPLPPGGINSDFILKELTNWRYHGYSPGWVRWNYEGFEAKAVWPQFKAINDYLNGTVGSPRAQFEHNDQHNAAGTVRAYESIPLFSGRNILEGLYMQSIISSPYAFYIQAEISEQQSCPFWAAFPCTSFNLDNGTRHLNMFNVKHIVVRSEKLKRALMNRTDWRFVFAAEPFEVWEVMSNPDHYVTVPKNEPVLFKVGKWKEWKNISYNWFRQMTYIDTPLVFVTEYDEKDRSRFKNVITDMRIDDIPSVPLNRQCNIQDVVKEEEISFSTDCVGLPHIISISDYPSWQIDYGADKIYLVSPSFMLVYPTQSKVRIVYKKILVDWGGIFLSAAAVVVIAYAFISRNRGVRKFFCLN